MSCPSCEAWKIAKPERYVAFTSGLREADRAFTTADVIVNVGPCFGKERHGRAMVLCCCEAAGAHRLGSGAAVVWGMPGRELEDAAATVDDAVLFLAVPARNETEMGQAMGHPSVWSLRDACATRGRVLWPVRAASGRTFLVRSTRLPHVVEAPLP